MMNIIGRRCLAANQCPSGADCIQGECKCTQGLTLSRFGFCIPVTYGEIPSQELIDDLGSVKHKIHKIPEA